VEVSCTWFQTNRYGSLSHRVERLTFHRFPGRKFTGGESVRVWSFRALWRLSAIRGYNEQVTVKEEFVKKLADLSLPHNVREALQVARARLSTEFNVDRMLLFGSVVRESANDQSDEDLLIVLRDPVDHKVRNRISSIILDINLDYGTNLSELIVDRETWDHGIPSALPIHEIIDEEGVSL
jgi:predicted nucleotidyltransferase